MALDRYRAKRDFRQTTEPKGAPARRKAAAGKLPAFVVQKHDASRLHYDFRLEMNGVLKSWAVPKGLPLKHGEKRLAMHVEDHPLEYGGFEGVIPEGNYGAGTVLLWDHGTFELLGGDPGSVVDEGKIHICLHGEKLKGEWTLVRIKNSRAAKGNEWLLLKTGEDAPPISKKIEARSVTSHRTLEQIRNADDAHWDSNRSTGAVSAKKKPATRAPARPWTSRVSDLPPGKAQFIEPMKCLLLSDLPRGREWLYELKFDGYRALAVRHDGRVSLLSRNRKSLNDSFPSLVRDLDALPSAEVVLDGEIVALDSDGRSSFQLLQRFRLTPNDPPPLFYYAFDLLVLDGRDLRKLPLSLRKAWLEALVGELPDSIRFSAGMEAAPARLLDEMKRRGLEGLIAKKRDSAYESGRRSGAWVKFKWTREQEFVIGGFTEPEGSRDFFGAVLVGYHDAGRLLFASKVGSGFDQRLLADLYGRFQPLIRKECPFANLPEERSGRFGQGLTATAMKRCTWISPELVCRVRFAEWTSDDHLRQPVFLGLEEGRDSREVVRETPVEE